MIIYIHGFGGSGKGVKASIFREHFTQKNTPFLAPSLSYVPELAISTLEEIISSYKRYNQEPIGLIGSSLGGFYAIYLSQKFNLKAVLINPATQVSKTLQDIIQNEKRALNYFDLSYFEFNSNHLNMLKRYLIPKEKLRVENFLLMLQRDDDVIDYTIAKEIFDGAKMVITEGGGHSFEGIERYFEDIDSFLAPVP